ncbi:MULTISPECIES: VOC family protein [Bosea]|uniref:VOC family protein n=1 Tax=Bosea TaxID=85413 RepID=UPI00214F95C1|nr:MULTISPECIES: VOC family protein [Bosea]MCR4521733.1 VOC family protein [Bosea sp. 47.2.35]MDR6827255.1 catechol 2,3-dioxygenase-like lactoylglutathione lyase family enzyme [Bosea robiniae]MDR6893965.1 catechol 2,3-dioxygenase-like lactoylglutathione lyase family enzyme [Bosea sp. BE109]MDR7137360.1 catechol 2,3-dioxygenase-like lactoylglutathione lyase family enzyme [Bosea sp. BE168]MDR7174060.1 catechol 2,3-dioxygenase-like lactoylglutathione lyase family enzyme [Bosea sp. BE271]
MPANASTPRGLDHLVIGVRDLDAAWHFYEKLGFRVGARNRHPWGTENRIVQFPGSFLELVTIADDAAIPPHGERRFSFGAFVREALAGQGEGLSMVVLESTDAKADAAAFKAQGIGDFEPFFFERRARRPDGSDVRVAFELAFAADSRAPECGFFVCQQFEPQNFWNPEFQHHPNGATALSAVVMLAEEPAFHRAFLSAFSGGAEVLEGNEDYVLALPRGRIDVLDPEAAQGAYHVEPDTTPARFLGFCISVPDLEAVAERLTENEVSFQRGEERLFVPAEEAFGCMVAFEQG